MNQTSELTLQWIAFSKLIWVAVFALLYGLGGMSGKWKRRWVGSFWLVCGVCLYSYFMNNFSWWYLLYYPLLVASLSLGYGSRVFKVKIRKRFIYGSALAVAPIPIVIINGAWILFGMHIVLCVGTSILLGVWNPCMNSREEELLIGTMSGTLPLFMI